MNAYWAADKHFSLDQSYKKMRVANALEVLKSGVNHDLTIEGFLVSGDETWLTDSLTEVATSMRLYLPHSLVQEALLDEVPIWFGGPVYQDQCVLFCRIEKGKVEPRVLQIIREDAKYVVSFEQLYAQPNNPADA